MAYIPPQKVTAKQVLTFIKQFNKRYNQLPYPKQIASYFGVCSQTVYTKLNNLQDFGKIERVKVKTHSFSYKLKS